MASENFSLNFFTYMVLRKLDEGLTPKKIAISLGVKHVNNVLYYIKKLEKHGYIVKKFRSSHGTYYQLTKAGKELLREAYDYFEGQQVKKSSRGVRLRLHGFGMRFLIVKKGSFRWDREWLMRNWLKRYASFGNVSVEETSRHIIVYVRDLYGSNSWRLLVEAIQICLRFASHFSKMTGYILGPGELYRFPEFAIEGDPVSRLVLKDFSRIQVLGDDRVLKFEKSPGRPETEFEGALSAEDAQKWYDMPDNVSYALKKLMDLEARLDRLEKAQNKIADALDKIVSFFERLERPGFEPGPRESDVGEWMYG